MRGLPANIHVLGDTPHDWLFARTSCIVHHGGAGTSHAAARSGAPSVVLPFAGDQHFWAGRLARLGVATVCSDARKLDAAALRILIGQAEGLRDRARDVAARMALEDGVRDAATELARALGLRVAGAFRKPLAIEQLRLAVQC